MIAVTNEATKVGTRTKGISLRIVKCKASQSSNPDCWIPALIAKPPPSTSTMSHGKPTAVFLIVTIIIKTVMITMRILFIEDHNNNNKDKDKDKDKSRMCHYNYNYQSRMRFIFLDGSKDGIRNSTNALATLTVPSFGAVLGGKRSPHPPISV